ncbi:hypothetical protein PG991_009308 [Apiospora marii]|uniref:Uncharacterized protein n=1 Tax=Apiospora marii TaxID=335849 RepID=A0ABR1RLL1_9PEZI
MQQAKYHGTERKLDNSPTRVVKKRKKSQVVNIKATKAWLSVDDERGLLEFTRQRGYGGKPGSWVRRDEYGIMKLNGESLLSYGSDLCVEIRPNCEWLPVRVRWNGGTDFKGVGPIEREEYTIDDAAMIGLMSGCDSTCVGYVHCR